MADVKWIKIATDIFDNRKIKQIEAMPKGEAIIVIWIKLICLAGTINDGGRIYFTDDIPYTPEMLATQFTRPVQIIRLALDTFERFGMIDRTDGFISLSSWGKYQSADKLEKMNASNRERQARHRAKKRDASAAEDVTGNVTVTLPVTQSNAIDIDIDRDKEEDKEKETTKESGPDGPAAPAIDYKAIQAMYNATCPSLPKCKVLSDARKGAIRARIRAGYTLDDFQALFAKAEASAFLKGSNKRNWSADFDWLIADANMAKVLDGKYDSQAQGRQEQPQTNNPFLRMLQEEGEL